MSEEQEAQKEEKKQYKKIAVVRIRGSIKLKKELKDTLDMLRLYKQNYCVILDASPSIVGMLKKAQSLVTWGEIDDETLALLKEKKQEKEKKFFRLHPPRKGFERKGIKLPFKVGGALGYRGNKINDLIKKMI
ncbi:uL30 family ribosomal protein [Candidatus Woesearchaeota archaeon]|nr:uL30 family ribosomal protein [Candidatus Woesearchaeota archaeon]